MFRIFFLIQTAIEGLTRNEGDWCKLKVKETLPGKAEEHFVNRDSNEIFHRSSNADIYQPLHVRWGGEGVRMEA